MTNPIVARLIQDERESQGYTLTALAREAGVSYSQALAIESGLGSWAVAKKLAGALGKKLAMIIPGRRDLPSAAHVAALAGTCEQAAKTVLTLITVPSSPLSNPHVVTVESVVLALFGSIELV